jgi:UrcA family protein
MNRTSIIAAAAIAAFGFASASAAATPQQGTMRVQIGDLNTTSTAGAKVTLSRIRHAAQKFCGEGSRDLSRQAQEKRCVKEMTGKAVAKLNSPTVTAMYTGSHSIQLAQADSQR